MEFAFLHMRRLRERSVKLKLWRFIMVNGIGSNSSYMNYSQTNAVRSRPDQAEMFSKVDTDGSGGVSQTELESFVTNISNKTGKSVDATGAVTTYDTDGSGELSQNELMSFIDANNMAPPPPPPGGTGMMNGADNSSESSTTSAASIISAYDKNGDGVLSSDELQGYLDETETNSSSSMLSLLKKAISAYSSNSAGSSLFDMTETYLNFSEVNEYTSVDLSV